MTSRLASAVYRLHAGVGGGDRVAEGRELSVWLEEQPTSTTTHAVSAASKAISRLAGDIVTICTPRRPALEHAAEKDMVIARSGFEPLISALRGQRPGPARRTGLGGVGGDPYYR